MKTQTPSVTRVRVEYDDGSCDIITPLQKSNLSLYGLARKTTESAEEPPKAYTASAIAALLFSTAFTVERKEYSPHDKKLAGLVAYWTKGS